MISDVDEPMITSDGSEDVTVAPQSVLQLIVAGNVFDLITEIRMRPQLSTVLIEEGEEGDRQDVRVACCECVISARADFPT